MDAVQESWWHAATDERWSPKLNQHIILLGDSVFDNAIYVPDGPPVIEQLRQLLPAGERASLLAVDGATIKAVYGQIDQLPDDTTDLVLSVGGNDALWLAPGLLAQPVNDVRDALARVAEAVAGFSSEYRKLVAELCRRGRTLAVCSIYDSIPGLGAAEIAGLSLFNDAIFRTAIEFGLTLIDLRTICTDSSDYSVVSPIEPSVAGGRKIAQSIWDVCSGSGTRLRVVGSNSVGR
ncbi:MAG: SGNH/GDSL hydrolase family protein [Pirellulales bacterium]